MGGKFERYFVPAVVGFAPFILFLLTWDLSAHGRWAMIFRQYSAIEFIAELFTVAVALREGMVGAWRRLNLDTFGWTALSAVAVLVTIAVATAVFVSPNGLAAAISTTCWIVHLLFGLSIAFLCNRAFASGDLVRGYVAGFLAFAAAFIVFAIQVIHRPFDWTWDLPAVTHIRHIGIYATPMVGFSIGALATRKGTAWVAAFAVAALGLGLALWTGSRGPIAALTAATLLGLAIPATRRIKAWGGALLALLLATAIVAALPVPAANMGVGRTITATTQSGDIGTGRSQLWRLVAHAIERRPVFGYGEGQMTTVAPFGRMGQPHNIILQLLLAWGAVGLLCAGVLAFWFLRRALPAVRANERELLGPLLAMFALVALSMVDAALSHVVPVSIFAGCAGMIAANWNRKAVSSAHR